MGLDIRLPIGLLLAINGLVLVIYGLASNPEVYLRSLGINMNVSWGAVLFVVGAVFLWLGRRGRSAS